MNTSITVAEILQLEYFQNHKVIAGEKALKNIVTYAVTTEVTDIDSILPSGTMLATLATNFKNDEKAFCDWIKKLHKAGVAALCVKTGRYIEEIPDSVLTVADNLPFPVIVSPPQSNPAGFTKTIMQIIYKAENAKAQLMGDSSDFVKMCFRYDDLDKKRQTQLLLEAKISGFNVKDPYFLFVYDVSSLTQQDQESIYSTILYDLRVEDPAAFGAILDEFHLFFYHPKTPSTNVYVPTPKQKRVAERTADCLRPFGINLFVSQQLVGMAHIKEAFYEMVSCIEISQYMKNKDISSPVFFNDASFMLVLHELLLNQKLCENYIQSKLLSPMEKETPARQLEIIQFLRIYIMFDGKVKNMADIMHVHPNTVLYRIQYIENVFGCSLKNNDTVWNFHFAIMLYDIRRKQKHLASAEPSSNTLLHR